MPIAAHTQVAEPHAAELLPPMEHDAPATRFLRTDAGENEEDRAMTITVPVNAKKFVAKLGRLLRYNLWVFSKRKPAWVLEHYPDFFKGYVHFYNKRMYYPGY
ncbi:hypothetical protein DVH05_008648 [Phytophthora capsici]|nr:hypothetical protein DVH05_008648 [Phytophthora capsici]